MRPWKPGTIWSHWYSDQGITSSQETQLCVRHIWRLCRIHTHLLHLIDSAPRMKDFLVCGVCYAPDTLALNLLAGSISGHIKSQIPVSCRNLGPTPIKHPKVHLITWLAMEYANQTHTHTHTSPVIRQSTPRKLSATFDVNNVPQTMLTLLSIFIITQGEKKQLLRLSHMLRMKGRQSAAQLLQGVLPPVLSAGYSHYFLWAPQPQKQLKQMVISASIAALNRTSEGQKMIKYTSSCPASGWIVNATRRVVRDSKENK